jgi:Fe-S-cluster-containing hydrogenase component 2/flavodoxin
MSTDIYYFSGTGNSLYIARGIAEKLDGNIYSIPHMITQETIKPVGDKICLVFPVYFGGIPRIIRRFVKKLRNLESKYIYSVCTCENTTGTTFEVLNKIVKHQGGKLSAAFAVRMPGSFIIGGESVCVERQNILFNDWKIKLSDICNIIDSKDANDFEEIQDSDDVLGNFLLSSNIVNLLLSKITTKRDKYFYINEKCNKCCICSKICPVENIKSSNDTYIWLHHCEMCLACLQWCPKEAIQYKMHAPYVKPGGIENNKTENRKRYNNPFIKLQDIMNGNKNKI